MSANWRETYDEKTHYEHKLAAAMSRRDEARREIALVRRKLNTLNKKEES